MNTLDYVLRKFNISSYPHSSKPIEVPNFGRDQLAQLFWEMGFNFGVEIGVKEGAYSEVLCKANSQLRLISIDPWTVLAYDKGMFGWPDSQVEYERYYEAAKTRLAKYPNCTIIRGYSLVEIKRFSDDSLDFVYIDGNHSFQNCTNDICEWTRKVRPGGIISGHDFTLYRKEAEIHVKQVVSAYTRSYDIHPWFVLGADAAHQEGVVRDPSRSWFWVKA